MTTVRFPSQPISEYDTDARIEIEPVTSASIPCDECKRPFNPTNHRNRICSDECRRTRQKRANARSDTRRIGRKRRPPEEPHPREKIAARWRVERGMVVISRACEVDAGDLAEMAAAIRAGGRDRVCRGCAERAARTVERCPKCAGTAFGEL